MWIIPQYFSSTNIETQVKNRCKYLKKRTQKYENYLYNKFNKASNTLERYGISQCNFPKIILCVYQYRRRTNISEMIHYIFSYLCVFLPDFNIHSDSVYTASKIHYPESGKKYYQKMQAYTPSRMLTSNII